jgi:hypothetical protein
VVDTKEEGGPYDMGKDLDALAKELAEERISRGKALKRLGAALLGGSLLAVFPGVASAAPRTCVECRCGVGNPCNVKEEFCQEIREFPAGQTCQNACSRRNLRLCGTGTAFHCRPRTCPAR